MNRMPRYLMQHYPFKETFTFATVMPDRFQSQLQQENAFLRTWCPSQNYRIHLDCFSEGCGPEWFRPARAFCLIVGGKFHCCSAGWHGVDSLRCNVGRYSCPPGNPEAGQGLSTPHSTVQWQACLALIFFLIYCFHFIQVRFSFNFYFLSKENNWQHSTSKTRSSQNQDAFGFEK